MLVSVAIGHSSVCEMSRRAAELTGVSVTREPDGVLVEKHAALNLESMATSSVQSPAITGNDRQSNESVRAIERLRRARDFEELARRVVQDEA